MYVHVRTIDSVGIQPYAPASVQYAQLLILSTYSLIQALPKPCARFNTTVFVVRTVVYAQLMMRI